MHELRCVKGNSNIENKYKIEINRNFYPVLHVGNKYNIVTHINAL